MNDNISFSLGACRKNAGLTLKEAAARLDISYQTLSKLENDSSDISMSLLKKMTVLYQVPTRYIFLGSKFELIRRIKNRKLVTE